VRAALIIAAHEFKDPRFQQLRSPATDVEALAGVLRDRAIGDFQVTSLVNQRNSHIQQELERFFSERRPDDLLLVYFSCHGVMDSYRRLHFATTTTNFDLLRSIAISASFVSEQMDVSRSLRIILLLDCCYSGASQGPAGPRRRHRLDRAPPGSGPGGDHRLPIDRVRIRSRPGGRRQGAAVDFSSRPYSISMVISVGLPSLERIGPKVCPGGPKVPIAWAARDV
jgi:hypothetical protein